MSEQKSELTDLQRAMVEHDEDMARLDRNNPVSQPDRVVEGPERIWVSREYAANPDNHRRLLVDDIEYVRATPDSSITEKTRQVALKLKRDADGMFAMPVDDEPLVTQWVAIITTEFGAGGADDASGWAIGEERAETE